MDLIVDANILFSALIKDGVTAELLLNESLRLFAPELLFEEFSKHKNLILNKTKRREEKFEEIFEALKEIITIVPKEEFEVFIEKANKICPDEDDVVYFALALKMRCGVWSNEKKLKEQDIIHVYSTEDLIKLFLG